MFEIKGFHKISEIDNWQDGCRLLGGQDFWIDYPISCNSIDDLKERILGFVGAEFDAMELDACDDVGRIDVQKMENAEGYDPSSREIEAWKVGEIDLYAVTYTCYVDKVSREAVSVA